MLPRGTVVLVELDPTVGHEQRGVRPFVAISDPAINADQRFPLVAVVPITGTAGNGALYPRLGPERDSGIKAGEGRRMRACRHLMRGSHVGSAPPV